MLRPDEHSQVRPTSTLQPGEDPEPWQTLSSEVALANPPWYNVRRDHVRTHTGAAITYTYLDYAGAVFVVPVSAHGELCLLRQYRYTLRTWGWEVPAGSQEAGEDGADAARRELLEEIGGTSASLRHIASFSPANGVSNAISHVYLAQDVEIGPASPEPSELMRTVRIPLAEGLRMAHAGEITDGQSALAILLCEPYLQASMTSGASD